jgi:hypothetical protein
MLGSVGTAGTGTMARRRDGGLLLRLALGMMLLGPPSGRAEVATDGTLGVKIRFTGRDVKIPARLGQVRGKNLFHSFARWISRSAPSSHTPRRNVGNRKLRRTHTINRSRCA